MAAWRSPCAPIPPTPRRCARASMAAPNAAKLRRSELGKLPRMVRCGRACLIAVAIVLLGGAVLPAQCAEPLKLRYGMAYSAARSIFSLPVAIAKGEGLFAREGL